MGINILAENMQVIRLVVDKLSEVINKHENIS